MAKKQNAPTPAPATADRGRWAQDPDGNWHFVPPSTLPDDTGRIYTV